MKTIKVTEVVQYGGHSTSGRGVVSVTFKAAYSELVKTISMLQALNETVKLGFKLPNEKPASLGAFMISNVTIDSDGESKIKFQGNADYVETGNLNRLPFQQDEDPYFQLMLKAEIDDEEGGADAEG